MTRHPTPAHVARAFIEAWGRRDMEAVARWVADDMDFESPMTKLTGAEPFLAAAGEFAQAVTAVEIVAVMGDERSALVMYDMRTVPFGTLRAADHLVVEDGKITSDKLVFDTHPVRQARAQASP
jgi:limonene-1,2-epoxide hydrolase